MVSKVKYPQWFSLSLSQAKGMEHRIDASAYNADAMAALTKVKSYKLGSLPLWGENGLVKDAFVGSRFKRIYTTNESDIPFFLPSDIENVFPKASKFISDQTKADFEALKVHREMLLISCSGTIGKSSLVGAALDGQVFSHDLLRVSFNAPYDLGYVYAFLNTDIGLALLRSNNYGAVIDHIEPEHLMNIPIPNAPIEMRQQIHDLIKVSYDLRDQSNELIDRSQRVLYRELDLPPISEIKPRLYDANNKLRCISLTASRLDGRLDVSYHVPEIEAIIDALYKKSDSVFPLGNPRLSKKIVLAGVFKRTYVAPSAGVPFLGGRDMMCLTPKVNKYLSKSVHKKRIEKELAVFENYILISDRGTIGKVAIVPKHWNGWAVSQNIIKVIPSDSSIAGYLYAFLSTSYAHKLLLRATYGAVVDMIDDNNVASIPIPILKDESIMQQINNDVLKANDLRYQAYLKEQEALSLMTSILES